MIPNSSTRLCCLLGDPIRQSISPYIHNKSFQALNLDYVYLAFKVGKEGLKDSLRGLRNLNFVGGNITMPLKEEVVSLIDELDPTAVKVGACNTILNSKGKLFGFNTDVEGFARPLRRRIGSFRSIRTVLIGAGGAARAAAIALAEDGCREVVILNRTVEKGRKLADMLEGKYSINARARHFSQEELDRIVDHDLIINASPLDFRNAKIRFNHLGRRHGIIAYDMVYSQAEESFFLGELENAGATAIPGNEMLIEQAAISFKIWTGIEPDLSQMSIDALSALGEMRRP